MYILLFIILLIVVYIKTFINDFNKENINSAVPILIVGIILFTVVVVISSLSS